MYRSLSAQNCCAHCTSAPAPAGGCMMKTASRSVDYIPNTAVGIRDLSINFSLYPPSSSNFTLTLGVTFGSRSTRGPPLFFFLEAWLISFGSFQNFSNAVTSMSFCSSYRYPIFLCKIRSIPVTLPDDAVLKKLLTF